MLTQLTGDMKTTDLYSELCKLQRKHLTEDKTTKCVHCGRAKSDHDLHDLRCDSSCLSKKYRAVNHADQETVPQALAALENLYQIMGWKL